MQVSIGGRACSAGLGQEAGDLTAQAKSTAAYSDHQPRLPLRSLPGQGEDTVKCLGARRIASGHTKSHSPEGAACLARVELLAGPTINMPGTQRRGLEDPAPDETGRRLGEKKGGRCLHARHRSSWSAAALQIKTRRDMLEIGER